MAKTARPSWRAAHARLLAHYEKIAAVSILILIVLAIKLWPQPNLEALQAQAEAALSKSNYALAYQDYRQAINLAPASYGLHLGLSRVYEQSGNLAQAVEEAQVAQELSPAFSLKDEINRLIALRDEAKAVRADLASISEVLSRHPDFRDGWVRSAYDLYRLKDDAGAKKALERALELDPNYEPALKLKTYLQ